MEHYVKIFPLPPIQKFPRHKGVGPSEKASLGDQTGGSANEKKKSTLRYKYNLICIFLSYGYELMSQDSRENFGVKSQMPPGGGRGGGEEREKERKGRKDMLKAGQSRGTIACVNGVMHYKAM